MSEKITICKNCKMFFEHSESICYNCNRPTIETIYSNVFWNKCDENRKNEILSEFFVVDEIKNPENNDFKNELLTTTTSYIEGYKIIKYMGICSGDSVLGTGAFSEVSSGISDFLGKSSSAFEEKLLAAKNDAMWKLRLNAVKLGANAIIGIEYNVTSIASNMIVASAIGTAVCVEK